MPLSPEITAHVDALVSAAQSRGRTPSLLLGVVRGGDLAHVASAGDTPVPTPDTQYRIGSITKTMTAILVMRLRDEGRLALDDPLERHLPGTPAGGVTIRQLLGHASGIGREPAGPWWERAPGVPLDTLLQGLPPDLRALPGYRAFHYSNLGYALLAGTAHRLTGEIWSQLVTKQLLEPLEMRRTTYQCQEPFARGFVVHPWHGTLREEPRHDAGAMAPAGQLWSTVTDLAKWAGFLADPPSEIIDPATVTEMTAPVIISDPDSWTGGFGLGLQLCRRNDRILVGHSGSMPGYTSFLAVHRKSGTAAVAFTNSYNSPVSLLDLCAEAIDLVLTREPQTTAPWRPAGAAPPPDASELCGRWWFMGVEYQAEYDAGAGELVFFKQSAKPPAPWRFSREGTDLWRGQSGMNHGELLTVRRGPDGRVALLDIATFEFTRDPMPAI